MQPSILSHSYGTRLLRQLLSEGKCIFNMKEAVETAQLEKLPDTQLKKIIFNLVRHGRLLRLHRGLYACAGLLPGQTSAHPFTLSAYLVKPPSAISHWSALQHHGLTEQVPQIITASTPHKIVTPSMRKKKRSQTKRKHAWEIAGVRYEYVTVQPKHFFGIEKIWVDEYCQILITDKERTLLDVFIYPKMFGGMGEVLGILENALPHIKIKKLVDYAIQYDKKSLAKRLGWALEYFGVPTKYLSPLLKIPISYHCRLDPAQPAIGACDKRWMIQNNFINANKK